MGSGQSVIVAGSRDITDIAAEKQIEEFVYAAIEMAPFTIAEVVSGTADGVDEIGEQYAAENEIPVERFPADWDTYGTQAGPIRNQEMAEYADAAIIIRVDGSPGSTNMIQEANNLLGEENTLVIDITTAGD